MIRTALCWVAVALLRPLPLVSALCTTDYDPVYCTLQGITFSNRCNAMAAGYDPADCTVPQGFGATCPATVSSIILCGPSPGTLFDNICLASQAGFVPSTQCGLPTRPPTQSPTRLPTKAPTRLPTRAPTPPPVCTREAATCTIAAGSKPCCGNLPCRRVSATQSRRTCQCCLPNASLCLESRDCCSNKCQRASGKLRCKA